MNRQEFFEELSTYGLIVEYDYRTILVNGVRSTELISALGFRGNISGSYSSYVQFKDVYTQNDIKNVIVEYNKCKTKDYEQRLEFWEIKQHLINYKSNSTKKVEINSIDRVLDILDSSFYNKILKSRPK